MLPSADTGIYLQLRSSRSNRHLQQDSGPQGRIRGGVVDHDPMEGLPVRRWEMMEVTIKQDPKEEEKDDDGKEGNNPNWPWPDLPLPKDFHLLPAHSQVWPPVNTHPSSSLHNY